MPKQWTREELEEEIAKYRWYHKIDLGNGVVTPGHDFDSLWNMIRETRKYLDYREKKVLDLGSVDGMWAFEAEKLGAELVVATDVYYEQVYERFLFCREVLGSKVIPYYNVSVYNLWERLDVFLQEHWESQKPYDRLFDIVQHLGILYHLRDPMLSLAQARSVLRTGGYLLVETAAITDEKASFMLFNGIPPEQRIYPDITTWWAPTIPCLKEMLRATLFEPTDETIHVLEQRKDQPFVVARACLVAKAISAEDIDSSYYQELAMRTYRNPGLVIEYLKDGNG